MRDAKSAGEAAAVKTSNRQERTWEWNVVVKNAGARLTTFPRYPLSPRSPEHDKRKVVGSPVI